MLITRAPEAPVTAAPSSPARSLVPLAIDVAVPLAVYYGLRYGAGTGLVEALIWSSVVPVIRTVASLAKQRTINGLATLMLAVNVAGIVLSAIAGDPRVLFAKDSGISSLIAVGILLSVARGRPLMSAGLRPFITKAHADREAAWERLSSGSARFATYERRYTVIWGLALLGDCIARLVCAFTVPIPTLSWLSTVLIVAAIVIAVIVSQVAAVESMDKMVAEAARA